MQIGIFLHVRTVKDQQLLINIITVIIKFRTVVSYTTQPRNTKPTKYSSTEPARAVNNVNKRRENKST